jgi:DNA replication protein DnaC
MKRLDEVMKGTGADSSKAIMPTISNGNEQAQQQDGLPDRASGGTDAAAAVECPLCGGLGFTREDVPVDHPHFGKLFPCRCKLAEIEAQRMERLRALSNLEHLAHMTFETFVPDVPGLTSERAATLRLAFDTAWQYAANPRGWLVLFGGYGCGKTHLAAAIANHVIQQGKPVLFVVVPDLLDHLRATFGPNSPVSYDERFEEVRNAPLLILDDLGTQSSTSWAQEKLFQILNLRYNARLPTVITSNHRLEEIDLRIRSRMVDPDLATLVTILAPDFRQSGVDPDHSDLSTLSDMQGMTFDRFTLREDDPLTPEGRGSLRQALEFCKAYAEQPEGWLVLTGVYGCGKTHLAAAIANARVEMGHPALFVVVPDLLDHLRATFSPTSQVRFDQRFEEVRDTPLLVLDDLGTESASPWAREKLYQLFNHRYNNRLPTVITTAETSEDWDPRLRTRMLDRQRSVHLLIKAPSYRGSAQRRATRKSKPRARRS